MTLLADTKTSRDPNMASLQSLIDCFFVENDVRPDLRDVTKEDVVMWVKKYLLSTSEAELKPGCLNKERLA